MAEEDFSPELENNHNVYVLGAGFSTIAGMPVVRNFLDRMRHAVDWLEPQRTRGDELVAILHVLQFLHKAAAAGYRTTFNPENVEELFSLASAFGDRETSESMALAISATLDFCRTNGSKQYARLYLPSNIAKRMPFETKVTDMVGPDEFSTFEPTSAAYHLAALLGRLGSNAEAKNTFISFNYDQVVEESARAMGLSIDYGLPESDMTYDDGMSVPGGTSLSILKLHGSINWAEGKSGKLHAYSDYAALRRAKAVPLLIPPTWRKDFARLGKIWTEAIKAFQSATRLCIIGFSLQETDVHFKYLLSAGLRDNISLRKIVFIDPAPNEARIAKLFRTDLLGREFLDLKPTTLETAVSRGEFLRSIGRQSDVGGTAFFEGPAEGIDIR